MVLRSNHCGAARNTRLVVCRNISFVVASVGPALRPNNMNLVDRHEDHPSPGGVTTEKWFTRVRGSNILCLPARSAHSLMGYCHTRLGLGKKAVVNYNMALQLNPGDKSSRGLLADAKKSLIHAGETLETIKALEVNNRCGCRVNQRAETRVATNSSKKRNATALVAL